MTRSLRVVLCCQQDLELHPVPAYRFWAPMLRAALGEAGHTCLEVPHCDWAAGLVPLAPDRRLAWKSTVWPPALDWIRREHRRQPIDLFLSYLYPEQIVPEAIAELRSIGVPCVNFFCDHLRLFRRVPREYHNFDLHWVPEARATAWYKRAGLPWIAAPMPCWIAPPWRTPSDQETLPPTFVGTRDDVRARLFAPALANGARFEIRGAGWSADGAASAGVAPPPAPGPISVVQRLRHQGAFIARQGLVAWSRKLAQRLRPAAPLSFDFSPWVRSIPRGDDYWRILRDSQVCLGVNRYPSWRYPPDRPDQYSRLRDLEAPMAGACYLTEWAPELESLYDVGREIEIYRDAAGLAEGVARLAGDPARRRALRAAGQRRALSEHTVARTIDRIATRLGFG